MFKGHKQQQQILGGGEPAHAQIWTNCAAQDDSIEWKGINIFIPVSLKDIQKVTAMIKNQLVFIDLTCI